jgi:formiminoglutamate deiminase
VPVTYVCEYAWVAGSTARDVRIDVDEGGRIVAVEPGVTAPAGARRLPGLTMPGLANAHSHAFHRALRGRTHAGRGTFWTWRERMYALAAALDPEMYHALATATFAEMALAGITCVGEFHYLHHAPGGQRYADPNEMGRRLLAAAAEAGIRITLLDTLYLVSTVDGKPLEGPQLRFGDGDLDGWWERWRGLSGAGHARIGAAAHSIRAVPADVLPEFAGRVGDLPAHVHLSEQRAENEACLARYGRTPTQVFDDAGLLTPNVTAVHATHVSDEDRTALGDRGVSVCFCPTTERDLADGIGPARALVDAGSPLCVGTDSNAVIDILDEARAVELNERLRDERRGHFEVGELIDAATHNGHMSLGWPDAGVLAVGARADLVSVRLDTVRAAGHDNPAAAAVFAATAADVTDVIVDGRPIVADGRHLLIPDVPRALAEAITKAWK